MLTTETGELFTVGAVVSPYASPPDNSTETFGSISASGNAVTGSDLPAYRNSGPACSSWGFCSTYAAEPLTGVVSQRSTMSLYSLNWTYNSIYDQPSSFAAISGNWDFINEIYVNSTGALHGRGGGFAFPGCEVTGQVSLINPSFNAYDLTLSYSCSGVVSYLDGSTGTGIAYIDTSTNPSSLHGQVLVQRSSSAVEDIEAFGGDKTESVGGIWSSTGNGGTATMLSSERGQFYYETVIGGCIGLYAGTISATAPTSTSNGLDIVSGSGNFEPLPNSTACGVSTESDTFGGTLTPHSSMSLTSMSSGNSATFNWNASSLYNQPSSLAAISGSWLTPSNDAIAISSTGAISEQDVASGCVGSGQISLIDPFQNAYSVAITYSACTAVPADLSSFPFTVGLLNGNTASGLASIDNSVTPNVLNIWLTFSSGGTVIATIGAAKN